MPCWQEILSILNLSWIQCAKMTNFQLLELKARTKMLPIQLLCPKKRSGSRKLFVKMAKWKSLKKRSLMMLKISKNRQMKMKRTILNLIQMAIRCKKRCNRRLRLLEVTVSHPIICKTSRWWDKLSCKTNSSRWKKPKCKISCWWDQTKCSSNNSRCNKVKWFKC